MSIRMIAKDLYHLMKQVEDVEKQMTNASFERQERLKEKLRKLKAERDRMHRMLEGAKS